MLRRRGRGAAGGVPRATWAVASCDHQQAAAHVPEYEEGRHGQHHHDGAQHHAEDGVPRQGCNSDNDNSQTPAAITTLEDRPVAAALTVIGAQAAVETAQGRVRGGSGAAAGPVDLPVLHVLQLVLPADVVGHDLQQQGGSNNSRRGL